jgi:3-methyl-2-oxobutanoate hydroxymethyltransferase
LVTAKLEIPTIGIGAGPDCDGQVLISNDVLGLFEKFTPRFVKKYANLSAEIERAFAQYKDEVKRGIFPSDEHSYH